MSHESRVTAQVKSRRTYQLQATGHEEGGLLLEGYLNFDIKRYLLGIWKNFVDVVWLRFFFSCFVMTWAFKYMRTYLRLNELNKVSIKGLRSISTLRP